MRHLKKIVKPMEVKLRSKMSHDLHRLGHVQGIVKEWPIFTKEVQYFFIQANISICIFLPFSYNSCFVTGRLCCILAN